MLFIVAHVYLEVHMNGEQDFIVMMIAMVELRPKRQVSLHGVPLPE